MTTDPRSGAIGVQLCEQPGRSRVHELARMELLDLIGIYNQLAGQSDGSMQAPAAMTGDRDRLIAAIRELEDPR